MDKHKNQLIEIRLEKLKKACLRNQFLFDVAKTKDDVLKIVESYLDEGSICSVGGSMTLFETGVISLLENNKKIKYLDRYHCESPREIFLDVFKSDVYFTSTNAITMNGELYNMDASGNRVAAMIYGPKQVVVIVGLNKIVENIEDAKNRLRQIASPANNIRLNRENPCTKTGFCVDCKHASTLCCNEVVIKHSTIPNRIHVIVVMDELGY